MKLGVVDQSPVPTGATAEQALANTIDLARRTEAMGYERFWLAEHHASTALAGPAPEILIARLGAETQRMRVGSGGVMLSHYAPLKVAESFRVLETLYPGRIDLGLGRAPGSDGRTAMLLARGGGGGDPDQFPRQVQELLAYLEDRGAVSVTPRPSDGGAPEVWLLGSSDFSAAVAAYFGRAFSFAHFINPTIGLDVVRAYREQFARPDAEAAGDRTHALDAPRVGVGVSVICAESTEEADRLSASVRLWRSRLMRGDPGPVPTVEEGLEHEGLTGGGVLGGGRLIVGDPPTVRAALSDLAERYGADELTILTITHDHEARVRSYELVAEAMAVA